MTWKQRKELIGAANTAWRETYRRDHWVYKAYDASGRALYIGCTNNRNERWATHRRHAPWYPLATRFVQVGPFTKAKGFAIEAESIFAEQPAFNVRGKKSAPRKAA